MLATFVVSVVVICFIWTYVNKKYGMIYNKTIIVIIFKDWFSCTFYAFFPVLKPTCIFQVTPVICVINTCTQADTRKHIQHKNM